VVSFTSRLLALEENVSGTHRIKGWVGLKSRFGRCGEEKNIGPCWEPFLDSLVVQAIVKPLYVLSSPGCLYLSAQNNYIRYKLLGIFE
jgi:hypothetical protein